MTRSSPEAAENPPESLGLGGRRPEDTKWAFRLGGRAGGEERNVSSAVSSPTSSSSSSSVKRTRMLYTYVLKELRHSFVLPAKFVGKGGGIPDVDGKGGCGTSLGNWPMSDGGKKKGSGPLEKLDKASEPCADGV